MVHRCCISSCGMSVRVLEAKGLSYHKFPTKEPIRDQWVQAVIPHLDKPEVFKVVPRYTRVCSRHFRKKDYCMDAKKRARLNSNAVPSVFPRKNTPLVIPTVLPASPKVVNCQPASAECIPGPSSSLTSSAVVPKGKAVVVQSNPLQLDSKQPHEIDVKHFDDLLATGRRELLIESATIQDDHLVLTVVDPITQGELEAASISNSDDQSQASTSNKAEEVSGGGTKRRKRRKWNRTAFARPAKGKRKLLSVKQEPDDRDCMGESLSDISLSNELTVDSTVAVDASCTVSSLETSGISEDSHSHTLENASVNNVTLMLSDLSNQPFQIASIEQELLQSIQAVSLSVGEPEDLESHELHSSSGVESYAFNNLIPAFLHHHSSEESLFSNEESSHNAETVLDTTGITDGQHHLLSNSEIGTEDDSLRFELVDLRIDSDLPPPPTLLDIDELAHQLNSSLFTDGKLPLFNIDSLNEGNFSELTLTDPLLDTDDTVVKEEPEEPVTVSTKPQVEKKSNTSKKAPSQRLKGKKQAEVKPVKEKKLKGVTKRPKKDKVVGKFSVERFKHSDKDIEYYTGFNSYRNFEAFFRSLEAYIERICITDVTYGVNNLPGAADRNSSSLTPDSSNGSATIKTIPEPPKKRSCQGRSMSRINELFMTIIRLRRKLPEKVLGHMFCISQPTVSRVVRAWTVLLSKIIDSYPVESSIASTSTHKEHSYTSKGMGIPDAFRDLFYSDLAKLIVVTSLNPKKVKSKSKAKASSNNSQPQRTKKSKMEKPVTKKASSSTDQHDLRHQVQEEDCTTPSLSDFLLNSDAENPVPIEQLNLFDYI